MLTLKNQSSTTSSATASLLLSRCRARAIAACVFTSPLLAQGYVQGPNVQPIWSKLIGPTTFDTTAWAVTGTAGTNVFVGGQTSGALVGTSAGSDDAWIAVFNNAGQHLWTHQLGSNSADWLTALVPQPAPNGFYCGGGTTGALGGPNAGGTDAWLASYYDEVDGWVWKRQLGTSAFDTLTTTSVATQGIIVGGDTSGSLGGVNAGGSDIWLARYNDAGSQLWIRQAGTSGTEHLNGSAPDGAGGVYLCGSTTAAFGGAHAGGTDAWLARYDGSGTQLWIRQLGTTSSESAYGIGMDAAGGVYVGGETFGALGGQVIGSQDAWVARFDSAGNQLWIRQFGTDQPEYVEDLTVDPSGFAFIGGEGYGDWFGTGEDSEDPWIACYDSTGQQRWLSHVFHEGVWDGALALAADGFGGVYAGGRLHDYDFDVLQGWLARYRGFLWVDFAHSGVEVGSFMQPYNTLGEAVAVVPANEWILVKAGSGSETGTYRNPCKIGTHGGTVTIGR